VEVATRLDLDQSQPTRLERAERFIALIGWDRVLGATEYTAARIKAGLPIGDPWGYVVGTINHNTARAAYLYALIHWIEIGLRAGIDIALSEAHGASWHLLERPVWASDETLGRVKAKWAREQEADRSYTMADQRERVRYRLDAASGTLIPDYATPELFLADLELEQLVQVVLYCYKVRPRLRHILYQPDGVNQLPSQSANDELRWLRSTIRNAVAHNRAPHLDALGEIVFEFGSYTETVTRTETLLKALRYNLPAALVRFAGKQNTAVTEALTRLGVTDIKALQASVKEDVWPRTS